MDALYVGRPLYQPPGSTRSTARPVVFWWLIPIYDVEAEFVDGRAGRRSSS